MEKRIFDTYKKILQKMAFLNPMEKNDWKLLCELSGGLVKLRDYMNEGKRDFLTTDFCEAWCIIEREELDEMEFYSELKDLCKEMEKMLKEHRFEDLE
jgi:hypothetical protein